MRNTWILLMSLVALTAGGCATFAAQDYMGAPGGRASPAAGAEALAGAPAEEAAVPMPEPEQTPHLAAIEPRKVVYTGRFEIAVADPAGAVARAKALAEKMGGYMQQMTRSLIVFRVPAARFDEAVTALEAFGPVFSKAVRAQDVTEEYVDLEIRLNSGNALLAKLLALLAKAQDVKAALAVEKELARVRAEVERLTGKLNRLRNQVAFATITAQFRTSAEAPAELRVSLPFWWLPTLGLERLMNFRAASGRY